MKTEDALVFAKIEELSFYSYRTLQHKAKEMGLPCNVKKAVLIELITAKIKNNPDELETIIERVKHERRERRRLYIEDFRRSLSEGQVVAGPSCAYPPMDVKPIIKNETQDTNPPDSSSRVLRSQGANYRRPNYSIVDNCVFKLVKKLEKSERRATKLRMRIGSRDQNRKSSTPALKPSTSVAEKEQPTSNGLWQTFKRATQFTQCTVI